jgi:hypothetical protein
MTTWTEEYVRSLVTDAGTLKDGQKLAQPGKWVSAGRNAAAAWGLAQGSAREPYRVCVELEGAATKCSCPSRKFPCKHAVGLMFRLAQGAIPEGEAAPEWVATWIEGRQRKQAAAPPKEKVPDAAAQAKREAARQAKVSAGVEELRLFLEDLVRQGLDDPRVKSYEFWDRIAGRMVDAQMSPIAQRLRALGGRPFQKRGDWVSQLADEVGRLYALTEAYGRLDSLPEGLAADVRTALGFSLKQEDVLASQPGVRDLWHIAGQTVDMAEKIMERRTWLYGENSGRFALLLEFAHPSRPFTTMYPLGRCFQGEVVFYPSAYPQRALISGTNGYIQPANRLAAFACQGVEQALSSYADALARNPFLDRIPAGIPRAWPTRAGLVDPSGRLLPLAHTPQSQWLQAVMGGDWMPVFGEWDGENFLMTTFVTAEGWIPAKSA